MEAKNDKWQGGLQSHFENEESIVPSNLWESIEQQIPDKKRKKRIFLYLFTSGMIVFTFIISILPFTGVKSNTHQSKNTSKVVKNENSKWSKSKVHLKSSNICVTQPTHTITKISKNNSVRNSPVSIEPKILNTNSHELLSTNLTTTTKFDVNVRMDVNNDTSNRFNTLIFLKPSLLLLELGNLIKNKSRKYKGLEIQLYGGVGKNKKTISGNFESDNKKSRDVGESNFSAFSKQFGFEIIKNIHPNISVGSGLYCSQSNYESNWFFRQLYMQIGENQIYLNSPEGKLIINEPSFLNTFSAGDTLLYKLQTRFSTASFSVPLYVNLSKNIGKFSIFGKLGMSLEMQNKVKSNVYTFRNGQFLSLSNQLERNKIQSSLNGLGAIGMSFSISKNVGVYIEERFNIGLTPTVNTDDYRVLNKAFNTNFGIILKLNQP